MLSEDALDPCDAGLAAGEGSKKTFRKEVREMEVPHKSYSTIRSQKSTLSDLEDVEKSSQFMTLHNVVKICNISQPFNFMDSADSSSSMHMCLKLVISTIFIISSFILYLITFQIFRHRGVKYCEAQS
jgi:hypothetical protein